jgi:hypothetical protein
MGSNVERAIGRTGFLVSGISTVAPHMEGVEGRTTLSPFGPTAHARTKSTLEQGQSSNGGCTLSPHVPVAGYDGRSSETMGTHRHQQHQHKPALYSIRCQRLDRRIKPRNKQGRLAAQPPHLHLPKLPVGLPLHRQICHARQLHTTIPAGDTQPPKQRTTSIVPTAYGHRRPTGATTLGRSFPTSSKSCANLAPKQQS